MNQSANYRRTFLKQLSMAGLSAAAMPLAGIASTENEKMKRVMLGKNDVILFQGDSITDWGRDKTKMGANASNALGSGYPLIITAELLQMYPGLQLQVYNKGISAQKVFQLAERWDTDCLDIKPNILTILIGVNDFWHTLTGGYKGTIETYRTDYRKLLDRTMKALPAVRLILMEPYAVKDVKAVDEKWYPAFDEYRMAAKEIASEYKAVFIPLQSIFDKAEEKAPGSYWTIDGVHPSVAGEGLIAKAWLEAVKG
ncbi:SGNH/GDSL hydrolase family protein [Puia sp. P3]|uniref:SGNH/GDSL hydrolase family protein n=1 Tax=Puia sp. P3 TaxID=3423952 RepID=UPI003D67FC31